MNLKLFKLDPYAKLELSFKNIFYIKNKTLNFTLTVTFKLANEYCYIYKFTNNS